MASPNTGDLKKLIQNSDANSGHDRGIVPGEIHRIEYDADHSGIAKVHVRHKQIGKKAKGGNKGLGFDYAPSSIAHVPSSAARGLSIGQKVHMRIHNGEEPDVY
jgi:hypothetical protein